jgi:HEPN domain-containing protein
MSKVAIDLRGARIDLAATPPLLEDALFHCQQAVEKAFKAFLTWHERPFRKTHSLEELGRACSAVDPDLEALVDDGVPLTEYAWAFRYPGAPPVPTWTETEESLAVARRIVKAIAERLPAEAIPHGVAGST